MRFSQDWWALRATQPLGECLVAAQKESLAQEDLIDLPFDLPAALALTSACDDASGTLLSRQTWSGWRHLRGRWDIGMEAPPALDDEWVRLIVPMVEALEELVAEAARHEDIEDGPEGPRPNVWMRLRQQAMAALVPDLHAPAGGTRRGG